MSQKLDNLLDAAMEEARAEEQKALATLAPLYKRRDALVAKVQPLEAELRELQQEIKKAEAPLREARLGLARVARAKQGTRSLKTTGG